MLMEMHLVFMRSQHIANFQMIPMQLTSHRKHLCGWRSAVTIRCIKDITCTCNATARPYKEPRAFLQQQRQDTKIKTVLFIYSKHLPSSMLYGRVQSCVNVYTRCSCSF